MRQIGALRDIITLWGELSKNTDDLADMIAAALAENDESLKDDISQ